MKSVFCRASVRFFAFLLIAFICSPFDRFSVVPVHAQTVADRQSASTNATRKLGRLQEVSPPSAQQPPIRILASRVIYNESNHAAVLELENNGAVPLLVAAYVAPFKGVGLSSQETEDFMVSPGIRLIRPGESYPFRIVRLRADLPADIESLYIVNLRILPGDWSSVQPTEDASQVKVSFLGSVKLFWRPKALANAFGVEEAKTRLTATCTQEGIELHNPSPYWCTVSSVRALAHVENRRGDIATEGNELIESTVLPMIAPQSSIQLPAEACPKDITISLIGENGQTTAPRVLNLSVGEHK